MQTLATVQGLNFRHQLVELSESTSSSAVRAAVRRGDAQAMIPDQVAVYIKQHRLYR
jgi:nicotinic acid mononucleotide adenylyltransferase